jgi:hypothetical protein
MRSERFEFPNTVGEFGQRDPRPIRGCGESQGGCRIQGLHPDRPCRRRERGRPRHAAAHGHRIRKSEAWHAGDGQDAAAAIDVPPKALVWEDDQGKVWLSYNSAEYLYKTIYPRHGLPSTGPIEAFGKAVDEMSDYAIK